MTNAKDACNNAMENSRATNNHHHHHHAPADCWMRYTLLYTTQHIERHRVRSSCGFLCWHCRLRLTFLITRWQQYNIISNFHARRNDFRRWRDNGFDLWTRLLSGLSTLRLSLIHAHLSTTTTATTTTPVDWPHFSSSVSFFLSSFLFLVVIIVSLSVKRNEMTYSVRRTIKKSQGSNTLFFLSFFFS